MPVHLTQIYTRTGDSGVTRLVDFSETNKNDLRLAAYRRRRRGQLRDRRRVTLGEPAGVVTEFLSVSRTTCSTSARISARRSFPTRRSSRCGSSSRRSTTSRRAATTTTRTSNRWTSFILPGGTAGAALLHVARTVARRAERAAWAAMAGYGESMNPLTAIYLNRVSDLLFVLARVANLPRRRRWVPGQPGRQSRPTGTAATESPAD